MWKVGDIDILSISVWYAFDINHKNTIFVILISSDNFQSRLIFKGIG